MKRLILISWALVGLALFSAAAQATVQRVIVVETKDLPAYLREIKTIQSQFKAAGVTVAIRAWRATYAGTATGETVVTIEVADLATLAKLEQLEATHADLAATLGRIQKLRKITSDSLYEGL